MKKMQSIHTPLKTNICLEKSDAWKKKFPFNIRTPGTVFFLGYIHCTSFGRQIWALATSVVGLRNPGNPGTVGELF